MKICKIEEIKAWQEARELTKNIYKVSGIGSFVKDYRLRDQIRGASGSIMANIAEGFDSQSDTEFIRFLTYSRRSATEAQSHLYIALDQNYINNKMFNDLFSKLNTIKNLVCGFIRYLNNKKPVTTSTLGI